jgi:beta-lactamase class A
MLRLIKIFMCGLALSLVFLSGYSVQASSLEEACDPWLQKGLEDCLATLRLQKAVIEKSLSVTLMDITDLSSPRMAYANPNEMMYAASLPKIAILLGAFERIFRGDMELNDKTRDELQEMIRYSSNKAATHLLQQVGKDFLANLLQSPRYRLYDPARNGGLWVGKDYSASPAWKRDPLYNLSHSATALQAARFYYLLETGGLVSPGFSRLMKVILGNPAINHKFVKGLRATHPDARIFRKSGTWKEFHSDSGIIEHEGYRYIAVALTRSPDGGRWLSDLIVQLDTLVRCSGKPAEPNIPSIRLPYPIPYGVSIDFPMK